MRPKLTRMLVALGVGAVALVVGVVSAVEFHDDIVIDGDPLLLALGEVLLGVVLAVTLLVAAYWISTDVQASAVPRIGRWAAIATTTLGVSAGLVIASQLIQAELKWHLLGVNILGIGVLVGIGMGYYDTQKKQQARTIERERDQFEALFTNVPTAVIAVTHLGDRVAVDMVNPAFEKVFGYTKTELEGTDIRDVLRPAGEEPVPIADSSLTGMPDDREGNWTEVQVTLQTEYGLREFVRISAPLDGEKDGPSEYAFYIDVTEQLQREERIRVMSRALRHDMRNRLNVIQGNAEMLVDSADEPTSERTVDAIQAAAEELLALSEQTRAVEKIVSNEHERRAVSLETVIAAVVADIRTAFPDSELDIEIPGALAVQADPTFETALRNVVENAIIHNDSETPRVEIVAVESPDPAYVDVRIHDNGPGISSERYESITGSSMPDSISHSNGMGLWVVNWVVNNLGGELEIAANAPRERLSRSGSSKPTTTREWPLRFS